MKLNLLQIVMFLFFGLNVSFGFKSKNSCGFDELKSIEKPQKKSNQFSDFIRFNAVKNHFKFSTVSVLNCAIPNLSIVAIKDSTDCYLTPRTNEVLEFKILGADLTTPVVVTVDSSDFEISFSPNSEFASTLTINPVNLYVDKTIYVKHTGLNYGTFLGTITATTGVVTPQTATFTVVMKKNTYDRGNALTFDGTNDRVQITDLNWQPIKFTVEYWYKPNNVFADWNHSLGEAGQFFMHSDLSKIIKVGTAETAESTITSSINTLIEDKWIHMAYTFDEGTASLYLNGKLVETKTGVAYPSAWNNFEIGNASTSSLNGTLDEFRIWSVARTEQQIQENMHIINDLKYACIDGLLVYYQFENNTDSTLEDATGNYNGAILDNPTIVISSAPVGFGKAQTNTITTTGTYYYNNVNTSLNFTTTIPNAKVVVSLINGMPHAAPTTTGILSDTYWIIENYGTNSSLNVDVLLKPSPTSGFVTNDNYLSFSFHQRETNAYGAWSSPVVADAIDTNALVFNGVASLSQFCLESSFICSGSTTWNGLFWTNGIPDSTKQVIISENFSSTGNIIGCDLTINNNAQVVFNSGHTLQISNAINVVTGSSLTIQNNAALRQIADATNVGNIIVKRNSSALKRLDYTMWSSPVISQQLGAFSPNTSVSPIIRFYNYNSNLNLFSSVASTSSIFELGKGYLIRMPNNHPTSPTTWQGTYIGIPANGTIPVALTNLGAGKRYNMVGNPYPSSISISQLVIDNSTQITGTFYFWRETNGDANDNPYCTWAGGVFVSNGEDQVFDPNGVIRTGQGFMVEATSTGTALTFRNAQRTTNNENQFFRLNSATNSSLTTNLTSTEGNRFWINLTNSSGAFSQMAVGYTPNATNEADVFDGKNINNGKALLNSIVNNEYYTIQSRALPFQSNDVVLLSCKITDAGTYTISVDHFDGLFSEASQVILLKDKVNGSLTDLKLNPYTFVSEPGLFNNRFEIVYQTTLTTSTPEFSNSNVIVYKNSQNEVVIDSGKTTLKDVRIFDIRGLLIAEKRNLNVSHIVLTVSGNNQVLLVQATSSNNEIVTKKIMN